MLNRLFVGYVGNGFGSVVVKVGGFGFSREGVRGFGVEFYGV